MHKHPSPISAAPEFAQDEPESDEPPLVWTDFAPEDLPKLKHLANEVQHDEWWNWPEAIAWVASRDSRNVATLRFWPDHWAEKVGGKEPGVIAGALHMLALRFSGSEASPASSLIRAILRSDIQTLGRASPNCAATRLQSHQWIGGEVTFDHFGCALVCAIHPTTVWSYDIGICRKDLMEHYPAMKTCGQGKTPDGVPCSGIGKAEIPLDADILKKMLELKDIGHSRNNAAKLISTFPGFEAVGNEHARRVVCGHLLRGRPPKKQI